METDMGNLWECKNEQISEVVAFSVCIPQIWTTDIEKWLQMIVVTGKKSHAQIVEMIID